MRFVYLLNSCCAAYVEAQSDVTQKHMLDDLSMPQAERIFLEMPSDEALERARQAVKDDACDGWDEDNLAAMRWTDAVHEQAYAHLADSPRECDRRVASIESWTWRLYENGTEITEAQMVLVKRPVDES